MNNLHVFENQEFGSIRTVSIDGEPWFVGKDVAVALGYKDTAKAVKAHVDTEDRGVGEIPTPSGKQEMTIINESGIYALIFGSKLESAKRFKHWVTSEVLPVLRKTGKYELPEAKQRGLTKDDYLRAASIVAGCRNERMPYVLGFLEQAGISIPEVEQQKEDSDLTQLSRLIRESSMSLGKISELTNICKGSLSAYLNCKSRPSPERYQILIQVLS